MNRLELILTTGQESERSDALRRLLAGIRDHSAQALAPVEVQYLCNHITSSSERWVGWFETLGWALLMQSAPSTVARDLALRRTAMESAGDRGLAFTYIATHFPSDAEVMSKHYRRARDSNLLLAIGCYLGRKDISDAMDVWIDASRYPMSHSVREELELRIGRFGNQNHVPQLEAAAMHAADPVFVKDLCNMLKSKIKERGKFKGESYISSR